jgi:hypothetical protein
MELLVCNLLRSWHLEWIEVTGWYWAKCSHMSCRHNKASVLIFLQSSFIDLLRIRTHDLNWGGYFHDNRSDQISVRVEEKLMTVSHYLCSIAALQQPSFVFGRLNCKEAQTPVNPLRSALSDRKSVLSRDQGRYLRNFGNFRRCLHLTSFSS